VLKPGPWSPWGHRNDSLEKRVVFAFKVRKENALSIPREGVQVTQKGTGFKTEIRIPVGAQDDS